MNNNPAGSPWSKFSYQFAVIIIQTLSVALAWVVLYHFNQYIFDDLVINRYITWIFLPAFIRMLAVMVFEWAGVAGLILGAYITRDLHSSSVLTPLIFALISGLAPYFAMRFCQRILHLPQSFEGLKGYHLFVFAFFGSLVTVCLNHLSFNYFAMDCNLYTFTSMLVGDFVGALMMLYSAAFMLKFLKPYMQS